MSAILTREAKGVKDIWEMHGKPCFSLWENTKVPAFSCSDEEEADREKTLDKYLDFIRDGGSAAIFTLKMHEPPKTGKINNTTPVIASLPFRLNEEIERRSVQPAGGNMDMINQLFTAKLDLLEERYKQKLEQKDREIALLAASLDEEEEEEEQEEQDLGTIGNIMNLPNKYPSLRGPFEKLLNSAVEMFTDAITVAKFKTGKMAGAAINGVPPASQEAPAAAANVTPDVQLNKALETLRDWYIITYGGPISEADTQQEREQKYMTGFKQLADDMTILASITSDTDTMNLALKKLRAFA